MTTKDFIQILQQPQTVSQEQTNALSGIIEEFPYFQSARAVYLKGLKNKESFKYNQALKQTAAYTTDRSILFDFITSESFNQNEISDYIKQNTAYINNLDVTAEDISVNKSVTFDDDLDTHIKATKEIINPELFQPKIEIKEIAEFNKDEVETEDQKEKTPEKVLNIGKPLEFDKTETHSFNEWLKLTSFNPIERNEDTSIEEETNNTSESSSEQESDRDKKFELIDKFIASNPKLEPAKTSGKKQNLAKDRMIQPEALMTETLARIYVEQKNYKKAIQSYKILSLKYPEKSGFFADQIKAIEQLQE
ncbi:hypothetical protein FHS04_002035 [Mesoflavibacter sabulilitoris]|uniref:Tetratricopeptide repeat protein n=1 Tax=Mesoflavibacter zeaxanthinifaciens subsp. sabulilitoris TaxID=1520893 RepID=A0A2T1NLY4_9FLAO|nr:hypothetical protein [Mesoflavibacter zeaxanthinifaciens]MBB3124512.1 hypothetical protein [Mesoflavibacter zeaxanthinifaciens subsp. sabulilitoris]PSG93882.1 hypothetical protein C7H61_01530 [Mesoflavibacter zeaxanthinifaciens subsp. sabulilitoris]